MNTCTKIRKKRTEKGFSQDYMAIQLGVSQKTYGRLENGESKIDIEKIANLANILETNPIELLNFNGFDNSKKPKGDENNNNHFFEKECRHYETFIKHLEEENGFLRELIRNGFS
ncbi:MAG: helix-turn-helix domain-containing protein [Bacteroidales bacterium]|nr:helix-turn-helix domain-containing protein [Bacteroidales bacterium]